MCRSHTVPMFAPRCSLNRGEAAGLDDRGAAQAETGGGGEVAAAVDRFLGRDVVGAELVTSESGDGQGHRRDARESYSL
jgi:hypothetical protein